MRLVQTKAFKDWHRVECARLMGQLDGIERAVDEAMRPENIKVEAYDRIEKLPSGTSRDS